LHKLDIAYTDDVILKFKTYLFELKKWNRAYNLTSLKRDEDIIIKHFLDSLLYLKFIPDNGFKICDIGSGAGFPGIPIALVKPGTNISLIEPSRKKASFLRHIKKTLSIKNIEIIEKRVENVSDNFDIALSRALFSISELIEKASQLLKKTGYIIVSKGPKYEEDLISIPEGKKIEIMSVDLPFTDIKRYLIKISLSQP
jgi:16S rRNA (guanine527-N7)-methyltransferase